MTKPFKIVTRATGKTIPRFASLQIGEALQEFDGKRITIEIKSTNKASDPQRGYWFGVIVKYVMDYCGYEQHEKDDCHAHLMLKLMPELCTDLVNKITGEVIENGKRPSWTDLERKDATEIIERAFRFCAVELGLRIPSPDEYQRDAA